MSSSNLLDVMTRYAQPTSTKSQSELHCWNGSEKKHLPVSYGELSQRAFAFGADILKITGAANGSAGRIVMITCHSPYATLLAFYGAISVGAIPMIFPMPLSLGSHKALTERIRHWGFAFELPALLVLEENLSEKFHDHIPAEIQQMRISDDPQGHWDVLLKPSVEHDPLPDDVAFFQTTSSSTGDHKAVAISHRNILANVTGIRKAQNMSADERMATWLPLFHDMGLVGTVLFSFCNDYPLFIMTPTQFVKRPMLWLKCMHEHKCTIATAPNFGFDYCSRLVSDKDAAEMDLSHVKHLFIGAEPIRVSTIDSFLQKFAASGIRPQVIRPAYGLAESTIITSMTDPQQISHFVCLDADSIGINQPVKVLDKLAFDDPRLSKHDASKSIAVCGAGTAIDNMLIEIVDENGETIEQDGVAGEIALTGTSVALGYVSESDELIDRFPQGRLRTGDIGVILDRELYILERIKNIVIRNGENFLVSALEEQLANLLAVSHEHIAVFESNIHDPTSDIVLLVERHSPIDDEAIDQLLVAMPKEAVPINRILLCKSREIPRTTSGKKRHFYCRKLYQKNNIKFQQEIEVSPQRIMLAMRAISDDA
jgi:acyl-CoA synthetase (AMP-forming)/AMP-acid ligase II